MDTSGIYTLFTSLGFTIQDYLLITLCPLFAAIGSMVHAMLVEINPNKLPTSGRMREKNHAMATLKWLFYRIFIGAALGLILGLYFVGSLSVMSLPDDKRNPNTSNFLLKFIERNAVACLL